jgi:hypothetical protein
MFGQGLVPEHMHGRRITAQDPKPSDQAITEQRFSDLDPRWRVASTG